MSVPYFKIGNQSARLVWQIMGSGGPIPNASGIRYRAAEATWFWIGAFGVLSLPLVGWLVHSIVKRGRD